MGQLVIAALFAAFLLYFIPLYWLITEPCNDIDTLDHRFTIASREKAATTD